jgi:hypothetical protein
MAWIELHQAVWTHRKTFELASLLDLDETYAAAHVIRLWTWALDNAPSGDLSALSDRAIAFGAGWRGDVTALVDALVRSGWLDDDRRIHDWEEYAGRLVERREANAERARLARAARRGQAQNGHAQDVASTSGVRAHDVRGLPDRTGPDTTQPDTTGPNGYLHPNPPPQAEEGTFPQDVEERLSRLPMDLDAAAFHAAAEASLAALGFECKREVPVQNRGDGHAGRLDLVASRRGVRIAFEFDDRMPRRKSIAKLAGALDCLFRVVVLRCPAEGPLPHVARDITVIGAGRMAEPVELTPATPEDVATWNQARAELAAGWLPANAEKLAALVPIGRGPDGGLRLRAPPWADGLKYRDHVAKALLDAGDAAASHVVIFEARPGSTEG